MELSKDVQERIKADANATLKAKGVLGGLLEKRGYLTGYIAGATAEAEKMQAVVDALSQFIARHEGGLLPDRFTYEKGVKALQQWKEGKDVEQFTEKDAEFMRECNLCPTSNGVTILTENDEGATLSKDDLLKLSEILYKYATH